MACFGGGSPRFVLKVVFTDDLLVGIIVLDDFVSLTYYYGHSLVIKPYVSQNPESIFIHILLLFGFGIIDFVFS